MNFEDLLTTEPLEFQPEDIGDFLLDILTGGLYIEPHLIVREYIQNSHDALRGWEQAPAPGRIDIKIQRPNIHLIDNGPGMSRDELRAAMSRVGVSSKPFGAASGFMGIGKFAGLSMAEEVRITSSKHSIPEKNSVMFKADEMLQAIYERRRRGESRPITDTLKQHSTLNRVPIKEDAAAHYTSVHLMGVRPEYWATLSDKTELLKRLGSVAPVRQDKAFAHASLVEGILAELSSDDYSPLELYVDGQPVYRPWADNLQPPRTIDVIDDQGGRIAYGWACLHQKSEQIPDPLLRGIAMMQRGIAIGQRELAKDLGLYGQSTGDEIYSRWYVGELYITHHDVLVTANRMALRRDPRALDFLARTALEFRKLKSPAQTLSKRDNAAEKAPIHIKEINRLAGDIAANGVTKEMAPSVLRKLVAAKEELQSRRRWIIDMKVTGQCSDALQTATDLIQKLASIQEEQPPPAEEPGEDGISVIEEEKQEIRSVADRYGLTMEQQELFAVVVDAIAEVSGGRDTSVFAKYIERIQAELAKRFDRLREVAAT